MAEKKVTLIVCDEPVTSKGNEPCGKPAAGPPVRLRFGDQEREKDLCVTHMERYKMYSRAKKGMATGG